MPNPTTLKIPSYLIISGGPSPRARRVFRPPFKFQASSGTNDIPALGGGSSKPTGTSENVAPWTLMGRMIQEGQPGLLSNDYIQQGLIRSAAARASNLNLEDFEARLTDLLVIMPFLQSRLVRMKPELLASLASDVSKTANRIIELKMMIPGVNMEAVCSQRPSLLLDVEWSKVPVALEKLAQHYDDDVIASMVSEEPLLLVEDVNKILLELERLTGAAPSGVKRILLKQPSVVHSVVSGTQSLGPGAEFMRMI